jgi:hypothetical protein
MCSIARASERFGDIKLSNAERTEIRRFSMQEYNKCVYNMFIRVLLFFLPPVTDQSLVKNTRRVVLLLLLLLLNVARTAARRLLTAWMCAQFIRRIFTLRALIFFLRLRFSTRHVLTNVRSKQLITTNKNRVNRLCIIDKGNVNILVHACTRVCVELFFIFHFLQRT